MRCTLSHSVILFFACSATAHAQCKGLESAGPFAGTPMATVVHGQSGLDRDQVYVKKDGFGLGYGRFPPAPMTRPDYDIQSWLAAFGAATPPVIDAMSMGDDWILADCGGVTDVPNGRWASVLFSITPGSKGETGTELAIETAQPGAEGDVFSYVLPNSALPNDLVQVTQRALDTSETKLAPGADIAALDMFMPHYLLDDSIGEPLPVGMMPLQSSFIFSLAKQSVNQVPTLWFRRPNGSATLPSGATLLRMDWNQLTGWSQPYAWFTYDDFDFAQNEEIDAVAVDLRNFRMLLSTDISLVDRDPILVFSWNCPVDATPQPYIEPTGEPVSDAIGLAGSADINAICAMDPSIPGRPLTPVRPNSGYYVHGTPVDKVFPFPALNGSAFRDFENNRLILRSYMSGWSGPSTAGLAVGFITPVGTLFSAVQTATITRPTGVFCGDPVNDHVWISPPALPVFHGVPFAFRWFAADAATGELGESYPVVVRF